MLAPSNVKTGYTPKASCPQSVNRRAEIGFNKVSVMVCLQSVSSRNVGLLVSVRLDQEVVTFCLGLGLDARIPVLQDVVILSSFGN